MALRDISGARAVCARMRGLKFPSWLGDKNVKRSFQHLALRSLDFRMKEPGTLSLPEPHVTLKCYILAKALNPAFSNLTCPAIQTAGSTSRWGLQRLAALQLIAVILDGLLLVLLSFDCLNPSPRQAIGKVFIGGRG